MAPVVGLRIDVDTYRGTRDGVPNLLRVLRNQRVTSTFFFSVGPDNMGRHLWRLLRPAFLKKMIRTRASTLYGWDILLRGTFMPGPLMGERLGPVIRSASEAGHEVGLHAWDHYAWQAHVEHMGKDAIHGSLEKGVALLTRVLGQPPTASAVPAWKCTDLVLQEKNRFPFVYNSDCRGESLFYPVSGGEASTQPQVPVTLPTYDEVVGRAGITDASYNDHILSAVRPDALNVLTIHAEVEGLVCLPLFEGFLERARSRGVSFAPLGDLLTARPIGRAELIRQEIPGREGWVSCQASPEETGR